MHLQLQSPACSFLSAPGLRGGYKRLAKWLTPPQSLQRQHAQEPQQAITHLLRLNQVAARKFFLLLLALSRLREEDPQRQGPQRAEIRVNEGS